MHKKTPKQNKTKILVNVFCLKQTPEQGLNIKKQKHTVFPIQITKKLQVYIVTNSYLSCNHNVSRRMNVSNIVIRTAGCDWPWKKAI